MITSSSNQRIKQVIQWQSKAKERRKDNVFVVEGAKMYLEAPTELICEVYVSQGFIERHGIHHDGNEVGKSAESFEQELGLKLKETGYEQVSDEVFAKMSDTQTPQGILAVIRRPDYELSQLLKRDNALFVILENLQDPGNLGTIVRTGEGAGITGVIMSDTTVDIYNPKVIRSTMGSIYRVPFVYEKNLVQVLERLHEAGVKTYAAHLKGEDYYDSFSFKEPTAFLIGNEGNGLTQELSECASSYLKIPMEGKVESLNAGIAAALLMYEAHRQRK